MKTVNNYEMAAMIVETGIMQMLIDLKNGVESGSITAENLDIIDFQEKMISKIKNSKYGYNLSPADYDELRREFQYAVKHPEEF